MSTFASPPAGLPYTQRWSLLSGATCLLHCLQANLASPLLDETSSKLQFLTMTSTLERFRASKVVLAHVRDANQGCAIM